GNVMDFQAPDRRIMTQYPRPDFVSIAKGIGVDGIRVEKPTDLEGSLRKALESDRPTVLDIIVQDVPHFRLSG
ncbi:MAG TPA: thiamine pyrophosphate-binding protein, partial [Spirochaetes bacterium]|nr:thiamine pyrophosphate-binding protein [Spirochaetota bacterium]